MEIKMLPDFIVKCLDYGIPVQIVKDGEALAFVVDGFYKSGTVKVSLLEKGNDPGWYAECRYKKLTPITDFSDLLALNLDWFADAKGRWGEGYSPGVWEKPLIEAGFIEKKTITTHRYDIR